MNKETIDYVKKTDIRYLKENGQFFTKKSIRDKLFGYLRKVEGLVLEPSCGTGEFVGDYYKDCRIIGIELEKELADTTRDKYGIEVFNEDFLCFSYGEKFDYIIGNPPYFEMAKTREIERNFGDVINGRLNIYTLFLKKSITMLKDGGKLAFVLPPCLNSGVYFSNIRKYIARETNIEVVDVFDTVDDFAHAQQRVMILILKKTNNTGENIFRVGDNLFFTPYYKELEEIYKGSSSLYELGYRVKTGTVVWNQHKDLLSNKEGRLLVWATNIENGEIVKKEMNEPKGQFIKTESTEIYPSLVINRTIGNSFNPTIKTAIIETEYLAENHINIVYPTDTVFCSLDKIKENLESETTKKVIQKIIGNTQLSKNEIEKTIPFFL